MHSPFWLDLIVRSAGLLLAGEALCRLSKASSAAFRHRLLLWVFVLLALLPVLSVLLPEIPISLWTPPREAKSLVTIQQVSWQVLEATPRPSINWPFAVWVTGFGFACIPLLVGSVSAWRLVRASGPLQNAMLAEVARRLGGRTEVLLSDELRVPVTCGLLKPRIVLPHSAEGWSASRLEAVLLHELAHVKRRDLTAQALVYLIAALWWFQPLGWLLRRRMRAESEFACDAAAISSGLRASEYAQELLGVAKFAGSDRRFSSSAIGMVRASDLEARLRAILHPPVRVLSRPRSYAVGVVLGIASIAASALSLGPNQNSDEPGGSSMKHTILSALLTSAGLSAASISGYIHDSTGAAVADAKVSIRNPDTSARQEAVTGSDGKFSFGIDGGQYILRIEKPGFASLFQVFDLKADAKTDFKMELDFTIVHAGDPAVADNPSGPPDPEPKRIRIGGQVAQHNLIVKVTPVYPPAAKQAGIQGVVELAATISQEGVPIDLRVMSSPSDDLSEASLDAVRQWRYRPTLLNGNPVEVETVVVVNYTLVR